MNDWQRSPEFGRRTAAEILADVRDRQDRLTPETALCMLQRADSLARQGRDASLSAEIAALRHTIAARMMAAGTSVLTMRT